MIKTIQYTTEEERNAAVEANKGFAIIEEKNHFDGNFLIFSDEKTQMALLRDDLNNAVIELSTLIAMGGM